MTPVPPGCPRCGAHTRAAAQWCTLCHADLRPAPVRSRQPDPALVTVPQVGADDFPASVSPQDSPPADSAPVAPPAPASGGKHARQHPAEVPRDPSPGPGRSAAAPDEDELGIEGMLAQLAAESHEPLKGLAGRLGSKSTRIGVVAGGSVALCALLLLVMAVLGAIF